MSAQKDTMARTVLVAFLVCLVCSIVVSSAAVLLKQPQVANKKKDMQKNILAAAGLLEEGKSIAEQFKVVESRIVDLETGQFVDDVDPEKYDQRAAAKNPATSSLIPGDIDIAGLKRMPKYAKVYLVRDENGELDKLILPISGYGLWSTLYGFIALESDLNTVVGLGFYDHGETPGLGGEVDNPRWKAQWAGKKIFDENGQVVAGLKKGGVDPNNDFEANHLVDGLSGATLTSRGVTNLLHFWLGEHGFGPFISNLKASGA